MNKRKVLPIFLCLFILLQATTSLAATQASTCLNSYSIGLYADGNGIMDVEYEIIGTNYMDKIGVYSLLIEEEALPDIWIFHSIVYGENDEDVYFTEDSLIHKGSYSFRGIPGLRYRVTLTAYAELDSDSDTGDVTSVVRLCT